jgi:hypothetical protein
MIQAPSLTSPKAALTFSAPMSYVYELLRAFGQFTRHWADTPIQNRRPRRCGGGLEPIPLQHSSQVRTKEETMGLAYRLGHL